MMNSHLSLKSSTMPTMSKVTRTILATQKLSSSTRSEKPHAIFLPSLYTKQLSQLTGDNGSVHQVLQMIRGEIDRLKNKTVSFLCLSQLIDNADIAFADIRILLDLFKHRSVSLSKEVDARWKGPLCPILDHKFHATDISTDDGELSYSNTDIRQSSATYHTPHFGLLPIPSTHFNVNLLPPFGL